VQSDPEAIGMNKLRLSKLILALALIGAASNSVTAKDSGVKAAGTNSSAGAAAESGVYGFAGARSGDNDPQGVIGECIWIFDAANKAQLAHGNCPAATPGQFRVPLNPGEYVVRGPGGNRAIAVKPGHWVRVISIVALPLSF
jgi:hypothetical protein